MGGDREFAARVAAGVDTERAHEVVEGLVLTLIVANATAVVLESVDGIAAQYGPLLDVVEYVGVGLFTVEFCARVAVRVRRDDGHASLLDPYLAVDGLAIVPFYVGAAIGVGGLGSSSLVRLLRLLKLVRYVDGVDLLVRVLRRTRTDLAISGFGTTLLWVVAASAMYFAEHEAQPEAFSSIPETLWWAGVTITTVGYGDVYPVTPLGRFVGVVVSFLGVGVAAVPSSIIMSGLLAEMTAEDERCPHCRRRRNE